MTTYVLVNIGCSHCGGGAEVLALTPDRAVVVRAWDAAMGEWPESFRRPFGDVHDETRGGDWPDNVVSLVATGSGSLVVFAHEAVPAAEPWAARGTQATVDFPATGSMEIPLAGSGEAATMLSGLTGVPFAWVLSEGTGLSSDR